MYADDTVIYVDGREKENIKHLLNLDLKGVAENVDTNELIINLKRRKTEAMIFGTANDCKQLIKNLLYLTKDKK